MVNPRYSPFNGNSRKPAVKQTEKILSETKTDFVYPPKEDLPTLADGLIASNAFEKWPAIKKLLCF